MKVALIGNGYLGQAYEGLFPDALVYDEPKRMLGDKNFIHSEESFKKNLEAGRAAVNACDVAIIAVPTDPLPNGALDMSIIEEVVDWVESDTILIKSALMPSTVDRLVEKTGKNIAVSVEYIGMGNYFVPPEKYPDPKDPSKHKLLVVGGEDPARTKAAELLWSKMSPDTRIHLVSAKEAEIVKLIENAYGALKVTFANCMYSLAEKSDANYINIHQAWSEDGRVDPMHTRVVAGKRGWKSHCYDKDIQALAYYAQEVGADDMEELFDLVVELNQEHLREND
jgi:UDP-glucose 6-dehydrogenase